MLFSTAYKNILEKQKSKDILFHSGARLNKGFNQKRLQNSR